MPPTQTDISTKHLLEEETLHARGSGSETKQQKETGLFLSEREKMIPSERRQDSDRRLIRMKVKETGERHQGIEVSDRLQRQMTANHDSFYQLEGQKTVHNRPDQPQLAALSGQKIRLYLCMTELTKLQSEQSTLKSRTRRILCKITSVILLFCLFFICLIKVFLFFSNQFIVTLIESFKQQLFDPHITNDELQLQIVYIEEVCFIMTTLLLFLFIVFCALMTKKFYMGSIGTYRKNRRVVAGIEERKSQLRKKIDELAVIE